MCPETLITLLTFNVVFFGTLSLLVFWDSRQGRKQAVPYLSAWDIPVVQHKHCANCAGEFLDRRALHGIVYGESVSVCSPQCFDRLIKVWCPTPQRIKVKKAVKRFCSTVINAVHTVINVPVFQIRRADYAR